MVFPTEEHSASCFALGADSAAIGFIGASESSCDWADSALCAWNTLGAEAAYASAATGAGAFQTFDALASGATGRHSQCVRVGELVVAAISGRGLVLWPGAVQLLDIALRL